VTSPSEPASGPDQPRRVSPLELFFDLVFVFTITQLTSALAGGVTLFLAGNAAFRRVLRIGTPRYRALALALALAAWPLAVGVAAAAGIALLTAVVAGTLAVERNGTRATVEA
jgi:low temperature requirement protein LtrA